MTEKLISIAILVCLACGNELRAEDVADAPEIVVLVKTLGADSFKDRMSAAKRLVEIGDDARPILKASVRHPDSWRKLLP